MGVVLVKSHVVFGCLVDVSSKHTEHQDPERYDFQMKLLTQLEVFQLGNIG
jgi:hypothetical protein